MKFAVIGTGNVAWHLMDVLLANGHECSGIVASSPHERALQFAQRFQSELISSPSRLSSAVEAVFVAVPDARITMVSQRISEQAFVIHTSGMTPMHALTQPQRAVLWPLLSLTQGIRPQGSDWQWVIQAEEKDLLDRLKQWLPASHRIFEVTSDDQRQRMHLAAVFANNFVNHLYYLSAQLLPQTTESSFGILMPLLQAHIHKLQQTHPLDAQTGPARRGDLSTIAAHRQLLQDNPTLLALYNDFTQRITQLYEQSKL